MYTEPETRTGAGALFFTPCATDATGFLFKAAGGWRGSVLGEPFPFADPQTAGACGAHED